MKLFSSFLILILVSAAELSASAQPKWWNNLEEGLAEARRLDRPLLVEVYAVWCGYCRRLRKEVYPHEKVTAQRRRYVSVRVEGPKNPEFMRRYGVTGFPHLMFMDKNGFVLDRIGGFVGADYLTHKMREVYDKKDVEKGLMAKLEKDPAGILSNYKMGLYYFGARRYKIARKHFLRAWQARTKKDEKFRLDALYNAAVSSMELKDYQAAVIHWDSYIRARPQQDTDHVYARLYRGLSYRNLGRKEQALKDLEYADKNLPPGDDRRLVRDELEKMR